MTNISTGRKRILVAEDILLNARFLELKLDGLSCDAVIAANGQEALDLVADQEFDAIIMDIEMPVMDGLEATRKLRGPGQPAWVKQVPILAYSARSLDEEKRECIDAGMSDYIEKPVSDEALEAALVKWGLTEPSEPELVEEMPDSVSDLDTGRLDELVNLMPFEKLKPVIDATLEEARRFVAVLESGSADGDETRRGFHKLVSTYGNLGLVELSRLASEYEAASIEGPPPSSVEVRAFCDRSASALAAVERHLEGISGNREPE